MASRETALKIIEILGKNKKDQVEKALNLNLDSLEFTKTVLNVKSATTVEECWRVYNNAPSGSEIESEALAKIENSLRAQLKSATTVEEYASIFGKTEIHSPEAYNCIRKMADFLEQK
ncbi:MAG: hypothetical protein JW740_00880 [Candidatus Zambryskibacteria bacterium]|nr:hypothetical protein [Candidatus Zambryskibacteria bacterium]